MTCGERCLVGLCAIQGHRRTQPTKKESHTTMTRDRIMKDLVINLREKLARNINDFASLCESAELDPKDIATETMNLLIRVTAAYAVIKFHVSAAEFTAVTGKYFDRMQRQLGEDDK
jgi:hypothetical protein